MSARLNITTTLKGLRWSLPLMIALLPGIATRAQINNSSGIQAASGLNSLGTKVGDGDSQTLGGSCNSGHCRISGGTASGSNLFHRLSKLRTNSNIDKITLDNLIPGSKSNAFRSIILSNIDGNGTYINTPFQLDASSSDLVILSPGGIEIGGLARFSNIGSLALSTAENLSIGGKIFNYQNSTATDLINMSAVIDLAQSAFSHNQTEGGEISIKVGDLLSIDADLILHSVGGIDIDSASNIAAGNLEAGGSIDLVAHGKSTVAKEPDNTANIAGINIDADSIKIEARGSTNAFNAISIDDSSLTTQGGIILNGKAKSTDPSSADYAKTVGVSISNTDLSASKGQIDINGVGASGNTLLLS
jgi:filamentous hemagglutinin family protein